MGYLKLTPNLFHKKHHTPRFLKARSCDVTQIVNIYNIHLRRIGIIVDVDRGHIGFINSETSKLVRALNLVHKFTIKNGNHSSQ